MAEIIFVILGVALLTPLSIKYPIPAVIIGVVVSIWIFISSLKKGNN